MSDFYESDIGSAAIMRGYMARPCDVYFTLERKLERFLQLTQMCIRDRLKSAKIQDVGAYFAVSDAPQEISAWDSRLQVTSRGYMPVSYTHLDVYKRQK